MAKSFKTFSESYDFNRAALAKQRLANLRGRGVRGARIANLMRAAKLGEEEIIDLEDSELDQIDEVLSKDAEAGDWIHDFVHSDNPKFAGKSKKERIKMALGAYYGKQNEKNMKTEEKDEREYGYEGAMAITQLKTMIRHADHMMGMMEEDTDLPEWVQSKITLATDYVQTAHDYLMSEMNEEVELDEGLQQTLRKYVPGYAKKQIDKKMDAEKFGRRDVDRDANYWRYKKVQDKLKKEEVEQIDELSKGTLASYAKKATNNARMQQSIGKDFEKQADKSRKPGMKAAAQALADKYKSKSRSREAGVGKAIDRLAKEEVELDEATPNKQQVKQAIGIARDKRYAGGNMTGATKVMDKINKGLAQHPRVADELKKQNEEVDLEENMIPVEKASAVHAAGQEPHEEKWVSAKDQMKKKKPGLKQESFDDEGNLITMTKTYKEFISEMEFVNGRYVHKGTYGNAGKGAKYGETDYDNEDIDKKDDESGESMKAKRGPKVGSKRGPRTNLGSSKLHQK